MKNAAIALFILLAATASCKKDDAIDAVTQTAGPLVRKVTVYNMEDDTVEYRFSYAADSTVDTLWLTFNGVPSLTKVFRHTPAYIASQVITGTNGNLRDTTWLDLNDRPVRTVRWVMGMLDRDVNYSYNAASELVRTIDKGYSSDPDTIIHSWSGGNMTQSVGSLGHNKTYTYDLTKPYLRGDPRHIQVLFELGRNTTAGLNLLTDINSQNSLNEHGTYQYDSTGRIVKSVFTSSLTYPTTTFVEYH